MTVFDRIIRPLTLVVVLSIVSACQSGSNGGSASNSGRSNAGNSRGASAQAAAENPAAVHNTVSNCRVISYDPRTQATIILVNRDHAWRADEKGQLAITNGQRSLTYKVLSDLQLDALLETFKERSAPALRENWDDRHAALLSRKAQSGDGFKGIIIVENNGRRDSYIARKPSGPTDAVGVERYRIYSDLRQAILVWERAGITEQVGTGGVGESSADSLGVPNPRRR